jgi:Rieske Fe-S protein
LVNYRYDAQRAAASHGDQVRVDFPFFYRLISHEAQHVRSESRHFVSDPSFHLGRRHLIVLTGSTTAMACSGGDSTSPPPMIMRADVPAPPPPPKDADTPILELDGTIGAPEQRGWRAAIGGVDVGAVSEFAVGTWRINGGARAIVARDARGLYAYSAFCTHERCLLSEPDARGVAECVCHGSRFDGNGAVMNGPATTPLRHFLVGFIGDRVFVDPAMRVADDVRVVPPNPDAGVRDGGADVPRDNTPVDTGPRDAGPPPDPCTLGQDVGPVTMFAVGTWTRLMREGLIIGRDARGLFAYSAVCTHQACTVQAPDAEGVTVCNCHGSRFDGSGRVVRGPASEDLDHFAVRVCAGRVRVDRGVVVVATTRTVVP